MTRAFLLSIVLLLGACAARPAAPAAPQVMQTTWAASFPSAGVAADHPVASRAGALILARGGNAVDAAVATAFTLSVVRPYSCGIGGGGFMVIHLAPSARHPAGLDAALNYRETTPAGIDPLYFERHPDPNASTRGATAVAVPGSVAGLLDALLRYGTLDRATVLQPAVDAAEQGFVVDDHYRRAAGAAIKRFREHTDYPARFPFLWERFLGSGDVRPGMTVRNPEQAAALRLIARDGADAFYRGPIADAITCAVQRDDGVLSSADLEHYAASPVEPIRIHACGRTVLLMPPPSSGGVAIAEALGILAHLDLQHAGESLAFHYFAEALKHAFADRAHYLADPAFIPVPVERMLAPDHLATLAARVRADHTLASPSDYGSSPTTLGLPKDAGTSHLSVVDAMGNAVACTETINLEFGSFLAVPEYGFCLNNEMDDFTTRRAEPNAFGLVQSDRNLPAPGKRPLSSMSPMIVLDDSNLPWGVLGASGGPRIISGTLQVLLSVAAGNDPRRAVGAPRFHHQWSPDVLEYELDVPDLDDLYQALRERGHTLRKATSTSEVQCIFRNSEGGWSAACDPRKGGTPAGY